MSLGLNLAEYRKGLEFNPGADMVIDYMAYQTSKLQILLIKLTNKIEYISFWFSESFATSNHYNDGWLAFAELSTFGNVSEKVNFQDGFKKSHNVTLRTLINNSTFICLFS